MPGLLLCGNEGEWCLKTNTLDAIGSGVNQRGSARFNGSTTFVGNFVGTKDTWFHFSVRSGAISGATGTYLSFISIKDSLSRTIFDYNGANDSNTNSWLYNFRYAATPGSGMTTLHTFRNSPNVFIQFDIHMGITTVSNPDDTLTLTVYRNRIKVQTLVLTHAGGYSVATSVTMSGRNSNSVAGQEDMYIKEVIITDAIPTPTLSLSTLVPNAVGAHSGFTGTYTASDDLGYDPADFLAGTAAGQRESWTFAAPGWSSSRSRPYAVAMAIAARTDGGAGVSDFQPFVRVGGVNYDGAALGANGSTFGPYATMRTTNPSTGLPWTNSEVAALENGILTI